MGGHTQVIVEAMGLDVPVESAGVAFAQRRLPVILESSRSGGTYGRYSILTADPVAVVEPRAQGEGCTWAALAADMQARGPTLDRPCAVPFAGGWVGFVAYETGLVAEGIEPHSHADPLPRWGRFGLYDCAALYDHAGGQWFAVAVEWPGQHRSAAARLAEARASLQHAARIELDGPPSPFTTTPLPNMSRRAYLRKAARAKCYIEAGDVYQINLTQRFTAQTTATPLGLYRRLRRASPSSHGAFLRYDDGAILSSSPELFLDLRDGRVVTRPIKGTRPRAGDPGIDAAARAELQQSAKDRAELIMIVDLLRNDLGRVCSYGSVRVKEAAAIEEHPTVFHQVATIEGELAAGRTWVDLLRATFPGGSVTGAPKIRAMQIIRELEPTPRGVYCGSIGWIGVNGDASFNIAIRTMVQRDDVVRLYAGGAIVADSEPQAEYDETLVKLAGMLRALNCEAPATAVPLEEPVTA